MRRTRVTVLFGFLLLCTGLGTAWAAGTPTPDPTPAPGGGGGGAIVRPRSVTPAHVATPVKRGPKAVAPGASGAELLTATGAQTAKPQVAAATVSVATPTPTPTPEPAPVAPVATASGLPPATGSSSSLPRDGLALVAAALLLGLVFALRAIRGRDRRVGWALICFSIVYLVVLGGVIAGAASAAPSPPIGVVATPGDGQVLLSWSAEPAGVGITVVRAATAPADCSGAGAVPIAVPAGASQVVDSGLQNGVQVFYGLCSIDESGPSTPTVVSATPGSGLDTTPPAPPTKVALAVSPGGVLVRWKNPGAPDLKQLVVVRQFGHKPTGIRDGRVVYRGDGTATTRRDLPFSTGEVWYGVFAVDEQGNVGAAGLASLARFDPPLRGPIEGSTSTRRPTFSWRATAGADYYNLQLWRPECCRGRKVYSVQPRTARWAPGKRLSRGRYTWYVFAHVRPGSSPRSFELLGQASFSVR